MTQDQTARLNELRALSRINRGRGMKEEDRKELGVLSRQEVADDQALFGDRLTDMTALLFRHDPIKLAGCGVPKDEYELEARKILHRLDSMKNPSVEEIRAMVYEIFLYYFSQHCVNETQNVYHEIALELKS
jgi:hypothetical protein